MEIVIANLGEHKVAREEIIATCPFCEKEDKFYFNPEKGMYNCKRGSCGVKGNLTSLARHFGLDYVDLEEVEHAPLSTEIKTVEKKFKPLEKKDVEVVDYLLSRGISFETAEKCRVGVGQNKSLAMPSYRNGLLVACEYRATHEKQVWNEKGFDSSLLRIPVELDLSNKTLFITEGFIDAMSLIELGISNVASIPNGVNNLRFIEREWDLLNKFESIYLCLDNDDAGKKAIDVIKKRLDFAKLYTLDYGLNKDINDFLMSDFKGLITAIEHPIELEMDGFVSLSNISTGEAAKTELFSSGLGALDSLFGGLRTNEVTIIGAMAGAGKSTLLSNMIRGSMLNNDKVAIYSGELSNAQLKSWVYSTLAGENGVVLTPNKYKKGDYITSIKDDYEKKIDDFVSSKLFVYDSNKMDAYKMLDDFEKLHKKTGTKLFIIDNLSIIDMSIKGVGKYEAEDEYAKACAKFVRTNNIHLVLIGHPAKTRMTIEGDFVDKKGRVREIPRFENSSLRGSASIVNLAHNLLWLARAGRHEKAYFIQKITAYLTKNKRESEIPQVIAMIEEDLSMYAYLSKNRSSGTIGVDRLFGYDKTTRRLKSINIFNDFDDNENEIVDIRPDDADVEFIYNEEDF